jgi:hypothetical protein
MHRGDQRISGHDTNELAEQTRHVNIGPGDLCFLKLPLKQTP